MEQMVWLQCPVSERSSGFFAAKLSGLDACEDGKVVRWCGTQSSGHSTQGAVDGDVDLVGMSTAAPDGHTVLDGGVDQG